MMLLSHPSLPYTHEDVYKPISGTCVGVASPGNREFADVINFRMLSMGRLSWITVSSNVITRVTRDGNEERRGYIASFENGGRSHEARKAVASGNWKRHQLPEGFCPRTLRRNTSAFILAQRADIVFFICSTC